ncbi:MAG: hypothetical protein WC139_12155 [Candidatus Kapaibacterium sp.]
MKTKDAYFDFKVDELNQESIAPFKGGNTPFLQTYVCFASKHNLINFLKLLNTIIKWLE